MKTIFYLRLSVIGVASALLYGCSDLKNQTSNPTFVTVHPENFKSPSAPDFHGAAIQNAGWEMRDCRQCHGGTYSGRNAKSCMDGGCHVDANGNPKSPESCNTCHGTFRGAATDTSSWAPPRSIGGDATSTARGVGAHQYHGNSTVMDLSNPMSCAACHRVPSSVYASGHFDTPGAAQVLYFGQLAMTPSAGTPPSPSYNAQTLQCGNTFCHGNWRMRKSGSSNPFVYSDSVMTGNNRSVQWTGGSSEAACGTCHGLPPAGHLSQGITIAQCGYCHYVTSQFDLVDGSGAIVNKSKHVNGRINLYGNEQAFR